MYENDLYNIDFGDDMDQSQTDTEPTEQPSEPSQPAAKQAEPSEPNITKPRENEPATSTNQSREAEQKEPQSSTRTKELTDEQLDYLERSRQRDALMNICDGIKKQIPDFDFEKVAPFIVKMKPEQAREYLSPLGLKTLWYENFGVKNNNVVDGGRVVEYDQNELADRIREGTASDDEQLEFYKNLGRIFK